MALQDIIKKIQAESEARIAEIQVQLEKDKVEVSEKAKVSRKEELAALEVKTEAALEAVDTKIDTMARRENRQALLSARRAVLDAAMEKFFEALVIADNETKTTIFKAQITQMGVEKGSVRAAKADVEVLKPLLGKDFDVKADNDIKGGFVCVADGMEIDNSFKNLVFSEYKQPLEMYFTDQLKLV